MWRFLFLHQSSFPRIIFYITILLQSLQFMIIFCWCKLLWNKKMPIWKWSSFSFLGVLWWYFCWQQLVTNFFIILVTTCSSFINSFAVWTLCWFKETHRYCASSSLSWTFDVLILSKCVYGNGFKSVLSTLVFSFTFFFFAFPGISFITAKIDFGDIMFRRWC